MRTLGNILWFVCGGILTGLGWLLVAAICYLTVVGIPFGIAATRIAHFAFFPFGKELVDAEMLGEKSPPLTLLGRILWIVLAGWWLALAHGVTAVAWLASCLLIVPIFLGAPVFALGHAKLALAALDPLGKRIVSTEEAQAFRAEWARRRLEKALQ